MKIINQIIGCSIGNCVHVAGVANFLRIAELRGLSTRLLGASISVNDLIEHIKKNKPKVVCIGYRLTPDSCKNVLSDFIERSNQIKLDYKPVFIFGGIPLNVEIAKKFNFFDYYFVGEESIDEIESVLTFIKDGVKTEIKSLSRRNRTDFGLALDSLPIINADGMRMPLFRHHFGLPSLGESVVGVKKIAESEVLDVISLAPDQNAQENFFRPAEMKPELSGAGGIPIRSKDDLKKLYDESQCGNYPYLRIYAGTRDLLDWAKMSVETINNAWGAIPVCWYSELDGRSKRPLEIAIRENIEVIKWYAGIGKPLEVNESHHWSLRDAPDVVAIAMSYISAYIAKKAGVKQYIAQFMFNTPNFTSATHDIAKMATKLILLKSLEDDNFRVYREVRAGLAHFSTDMDLAKGQLGMTTSMLMSFHPHIFHVVGYNEASHVATAENVIESCKISRGAIKNLANGFPSPLYDPVVKKKVEFLLSEAKLLISAIDFLGLSMGSYDPLSDPAVITSAIKNGFLDAPHLKGHNVARGVVNTIPHSGGCFAVSNNNSVISEIKRIEHPCKIADISVNDVVKNLKKCILDKIQISLLTSSIVN